MEQARPFCLRIRLICRIATEILIANATSGKLAMWEEMAATNQSKYYIKERNARKEDNKRGETDIRGRILSANQRAP